MYVYHADKSQNNLSIHSLYNVQRILKGQDPAIVIPELVGLKQGCPLSPILFNLYTSAILNAVDSARNGYPLSLSVVISCLAFADDLALLSDDPLKLQKSLDIMCAIAQSLGITVNSLKCRTLTIDYSSGKTGTVIDYTYYVNGIPVQPLHKEDSFIYLGRAFGCEEKCSTQKIINDTTVMIERLVSSGLAPPQIYDAILTFALPKLSYVFRMSGVSDEHLEKFDSTIRRHIRTIFHLPNNSSLEFIQTLREHGGLGIATSADLRACAVVAQAIRSLNPDSSPFFEIFRSELSLQTNCDLFVNALDKLQCQSLPPAANCNRFISKGRWSMVTAALKHLRKSISTSLTLENDIVKLLIGKLNGPTPSVGSDLLFRSLRLAIGDAHLDLLLSQSLQGRSFHLISRSPLSSHFYRSGKGVRRGEWDFVFSARLDVLPTGPNRSRFSINNQCRRCKRDSENLYHIMSSCLTSSTLRNRRHNCIAIRLVRAICFSVKASLETTEESKALFGTKNRTLWLWPLTAKSSGIVRFAMRASRTSIRPLRLSTNARCACL